MNDTKNTELRISAVNHFDLVNSWSKNFLYMVSKEWETFMDKMIDKHEDAVNANDALIKEAMKRVEFIQRKMEEEEAKRSQVYEVFKDAEKRYKASEIGASLVRGENKYYEVKDRLEEAKRELENDPSNKSKSFNLKKIQTEFDKYQILHQRYEEQVAVRERARKDMEEKEREMRDFYAYMKKTPFTKTALNNAVLTLSKYVDIKEYNQKTIFEDAVAFKNMIKKGLLSDDAADQLSKKIGSVMNATANYQLYSGEFSESDIQLIVQFFTEEMDKYNFKGFNFIKNTILEYNQNVSNEKVVIVKMDTIDFQGFLTKLINNLSAQINGAMHHGFDRYISNRNESISIDKKMNNDEGEGKESVGDLLSKDDINPGGGRIYDDKMFDVNTKDLMGKVRRHVISNKESIADTIFKILHDKLPERSYFYNPTQRLRTKIENALVKIVDDMTVEALNGSYIAPKVKNIILDAIGGGEHVDFVKIEINVIKQVLQYEFVKFMINNIEEEYKKGGYTEMDDTANKLVDYLKLKKNKTKQEINSIPIVASNNFVKPSDMAKKIIEDNASALEDKVDFLLDSKSPISRDDAKNNIVYDTTSRSTNPCCAEEK